MVEFTLLNSGYCSSLEKLVARTAPWRSCKFPAMFALIRHPHYGNILFDTGHSNRFIDLTKKFPMIIYRWLIHTEPDPNLRAAHQLESLGISSSDINYIIISHFHADHIGALHDFPNAKFIYLQKAYNAVKNLNCFAALKAGFLSGLLPDDFVSRSQLLDQQPLVSLPEEYLPFKKGYQVFNDEHVIAVDLPGHAHGQIGLFLNTVEHEKVFLIADACWTSQSYLHLIPPHTISFLAMTGKSEYMQTLTKINELKKKSPNIKIIPSHCSEVWNEMSSQK